MSTVEFVDDPEAVDRLPEILEAYERKGAPDPNLFRMLGRLDGVSQTFADHWDATFYDGIIDHREKEIVRVWVSVLNDCGYCGSVGSNIAAEQGLTDEKVQAIEDPGYEESDLFTDRERAALRFAEDFHEGTHDYADLKPHFDNDEIIELAWLIGLCDGLGKVVSRLDLSACPVPVEDLIDCD